MHSTKSLWFAILLTACAGADDELSARGLLDPGIEVPSEDPVELPGDDLEQDGGQASEDAAASTRDSGSHTASDAGDQDAGQHADSAVSVGPDAGTTNPPHNDGGAQDAGQHAGSDAGSDAGHTVSDAGSADAGEPVEPGPVHTDFAPTEAETPDSVMAGMAEWDVFPPAERALDLGTVPREGHVTIRGHASHLGDMDYVKFTIDSNTSDVYFNVFGWMVWPETGSRVTTAGGLQLTVQTSHGAVRVTGKSDCSCDATTNNYCTPPLADAQTFGGLFAGCARPTIYLAIQRLVAPRVWSGTVQSALAYELHLDIIPTTTKPNGIVLMR